MPHVSGNPDRRRQRREERGQNVLGLGPDTDGALARYLSDGGSAWLLLVQYPDAAQANAALRALGVGAAPNMVAAEVEGNLLGAVFGQVSEASAAHWLQLALSAL